MSARRRCRTCGADLIEKLIAGHLVLVHWQEPKVWHKPQPK